MKRPASDSDALDGYSVATLSPEFRQAAWLRIAYLDIKKRNWKEADYVIGKCMESYPADENAFVVKAMIERKRGRKEAALDILNEQLDLDPLNHLARFEKYLNTGAEADKNDFKNFIRQELPHETFIALGNAVL